MSDLKCTILKDKIKIHHTYILLPSKTKRICSLRSPSPPPLHFSEQPTSIVFPLFLSEIEFRRPRLFCVCWGNKVENGFAKGTIIEYLHTGIFSNFLSIKHWISKREKRGFWILAPKWKDNKNILRKDSPYKIHLWAKCTLFTGK